MIRAEPVFPLWA